MTEIKINDTDQQQLQYLAEMAKKAMGSDRLLIITRRESFSDTEGEGEVMMIGGAGDWGSTSVQQIGRMMEDLIGAVLALTDHQFRVQIVTPSGDILDAAEMRKGRSADREAQVKMQQDRDNA